MKNKSLLKKAVIVIRTAALLFGGLNLFWYQFKYRPYKEKTVMMQLNEDSERPKYTCTRNGYIYTLKMPGYLSFESGFLYVVPEEHQDSAMFIVDEDGNLTEKNIPHVDLFVWPQVLSEAEYRITAYEETESMWIRVNRFGDYLVDETTSDIEQKKAKELYEKHELEIRNIVDAAARLWGSNI